MAVSMATCRPFVQASQGARTVRKTRIVTTAGLSNERRESRALQSTLLGAAALAASLALSASPSLAEPKLPPLDTDPNRCERAFVGNTIGQANAVSDKILDLRFCMLGGKDLSGKTLSGALLVGTDLSKANMQEVVLTKAFAKQVNMAGADLSNAVVDRVLFDGANLTDVKFVNAVITGSTFKDADLTGATFEDALIGSQDAKRLCDNPTLTGDGRLEVGCRN